MNGLQDWDKTIFIILEEDTRTEISLMKEKYRIDMKHTQRDRNQCISWTPTVSTVIEKPRYLGDLHMNETYWINQLFCAYAI